VWRGVILGLPMNSRVQNRFEHPKLFFSASAAIHLGWWLEYSGSEF
jgi:hypothetical protein